MQYNLLFDQDKSKGKVQPDKKLIYQELNKGPHAHAYLCLVCVSVCCIHASDSSTVWVYGFFYFLVVLLSLLTDSSHGHLSQEIPTDKMICGSYNWNYWSSGITCVFCLARTNGGYLPQTCRTTCVLFVLADKYKHCHMFTMYCIGSDFKT